MKFKNIKNLENLKGWSPEKFKTELGKISTLNLSIIQIYFLSGLHRAKILSDWDCRQDFHEFIAIKQPQFVSSLK